MLHGSIGRLLLSLGLVVPLFGALGFAPGLSPAEALATETMARLTFGMLPDGMGIVVVAVKETVIGPTLVTGRGLRLGLALLGLAMVGVLSPLALSTDEPFARPYNAPTLIAQ